MDISVIVPIYKGNKYVPTVVKMLENNDNYCMLHEKKLLLELVFVNDYPQEKIDEIYSDKIEIRYIYNDVNSGIHQTRINGLKASTGTYIHMLDQDDVITDDFYYFQLKEIGNKDVVVCNGRYRGNKLIYKRGNMYFNKTELITKRNIIVSPGQTLVRRKSIPQEWVENVVSNSGSDDWLLWILMLYKDTDFAYNCRIAYTHVENGQNESFHWDRMRLSLQEIKEILKNQKCSSDELRTKSLACIEKSIYDSDSFFQFEKEWNGITIDALSHFLQNEHIKIIAIYGYGNIGKKLIKKLKECDVDIWAVDCDLRYEEEEISIYRPEECVPEADLMIVTPLRGGEKIRKQMEENKQIKQSILYNEFIGMIRE